MQQTTWMHVTIYFVVLLGSAHAIEPPEAMLGPYLQAHADQAFQARRKQIADLKTPADVLSRQAAMKAYFLKALGDFPDRTPLNARVVGTLDRPGYTVEKVIFESQANHHVTAAVYLPKNRPGKLPGVLVPCGHAQNGKAGDTYQQICLLLVKRGFVVLCADPIGQGERVQWLTAEGKPAAAGNTAEHTLLGVGSLLVGRSAANNRLWDEIRALDYLAGRPQVDATKLGVTGNSGGGTLTAYLMAVDDRVAAAAASCYITSFERLFATIGPQDAEQNLTGQLAVGFDHADFLTIRAPKPTMICVGTKDFFDIDGSWATFREAKNIYGILGHAERLDLFESNEPHGFTRSRREAATAWLGRWLQGIEYIDDIEPDTIASDADLQCTKSGQVLSEFPEELSAFTLNVNLARTLAKARPKLDRAALQTMVKELIRWRSPLVQPTIEEQGVQTREGLTERAFSVTTEPGISIPCRLIRANVADSLRPIRVVVGGSSDWSTADLADVQKGGSVLKIEPRGMAQPVPGKSRANQDNAEAFLALHLDRPLLGQRIYDVQTVLNALAEPAKSGVVLHGIGLAGPVAMHVALIDHRVHRLTLEDTITSWNELLDPRRAGGNLGNVIPGALAAYDLSDLRVAADR